MTRALRFLFATYEGGGHVPAPMIVAKRLRASGHEVLLVSDMANAPAAEAKQLPFAHWMSAPNRFRLGDADSDVDDWRTRWPPEVVRRLCAAVMTGPALAYARDTLDIAARFEPDVVVANELLLGVMAAAEARGTPLALLTANAWCYPTRDDVPPFGPGFRRSDGAVARWRDGRTRAMVHRWYDAGLADLNDARAALGLGPLRRTLDQVNAADRVLLGISRAFDYGVGAPVPFVHVGPLIETPEWAASGPSSEPDRRPRVLVSFGTTFQNQKPVIARCMAALGRLPVQGIVTLGPAVTPDGLPRAANVEVVASASHDQLVPTCAAVVCHGGHGTVLRPILHGVPVLCLPMGRDHPDNAARLEWHGAGLRVSATSSPAVIAKAVRRLLDEPEHRAGAAALATRIRAEGDAADLASSALIDLALEGRRLSTAA